MKEALQALNRLVSDEVIADYAIGGAVGAAFYIKAAQTEDIDAFVFLPRDSSSLIVLTPIYEALIAQGGVVEGAHVRFGDWPVQILTDANSLITEAIQKAVPVDFEGTPTRVFTPEHLCAVALQTGRGKDYLRVRMFLDQGAVGASVLAALLERFGLAAKMEKIPA
jgi:hypothetical protein